MTRLSSLVPEVWHRVRRSGRDAGWLAFELELFVELELAERARRHYARRMGRRTSLVKRRLRAPGVDLPVYLLVRYREEVGA